MCLLQNQTTATSATTSTYCNMCFRLNAFYCMRFLQPATTLLLCQLCCSSRRLPTVYYTSPKRCFSCFVPATSILFSPSTTTMSNATCCNLICLFVLYCCLRFQPPIYCNQLCFRLQFSTQPIATKLQPSRRLQPINSAVFQLHLPVSTILAHC